MVKTRYGDEPYKNIQIEVRQGFLGRINKWLFHRPPNEEMSMAQMVEVADHLAHSGRVLIRFGENSREFNGSYAPKVSGDAGVDVYVTEDHLLQPGEYLSLPSDISICMPFDWYAEVRARSSTSKQMIHVFPGIIDPGYTGEIFACVTNLGKEAVEIKRGYRLAQLIFHRRVNPEFVDVGGLELPATERGQRGFGSTGGTTK